MQLKINPSKCRSFSLSSGKPTAITFNLETIEQDRHKFLGSQITFYSKPEETYSFISTNLEDKLRRIDSLLIRGEYKAKMYKQYALPCAVLCSPYTSYRQQIWINSTLSVTVT